MLRVFTVHEGTLAVAVKTLLAQDRPFRLVINFTAGEGLGRWGIPQWVIDAWKGAMDQFVFDVRPEWPMDPQCEHAVFAITCSTRGQQYRAIIPWVAIWGVITLDNSAEQYVAEQLIPKSVMEVSDPVSITPSTDALTDAPISPTRVSEERTRSFRVIKGGKT